ncbi:hypothetical protein [Mycobacterium sp. OTB74]|jgi:hypothetical protein|uniref:hypothetical protein n=1 Tax=Mycobacterium sp. OTB74 TaxID=1853452 RepID=UPI0024753E0B|nr:hypothetical protein [Mycobacterium sp. OTB74]MDH6244673.1 hypothetical protein [Mycobacterium sp. OTB74]
MRSKITLVASRLAAATIGGAVVLAPLAAVAATPLAALAAGISAPLAGTNTDPGVSNSPGQRRDPSAFGWHSDNHDEIDQSAGGIDVPF